MKWETFIRFFFLQLFPLGEKSKIPLKTGPKATVAFGAFGADLIGNSPCSGLEKISFVFIHRMKVEGGPPVSKKKKR